MSGRTWDNFLVAFSKANKFVFPNTSSMQQAAESMWNDLKGRPTELDLFIKEVNLLELWKWVNVVITFIRLKVAIGDVLHHGETNIHFASPFGNQLESKKN